MASAGPNADADRGANANPGAGGNAGANANPRAGANANENEGEEWEKLKKVYILKTTLHWSQGCHSARALSTKYCQAS